MIRSGTGSWYDYVSEGVQFGLNMFVSAAGVSGAWNGIGRLIDEFNYNKMQNLATEISWSDIDGGEVLDGILGERHKYTRTSWQPVKFDLQFFASSKSGRTFKEPNIVNFDSEQLGKKWGKHKTDYPNMKSYMDYQNYANDIFNNPEQVIYDAANNEYLYIKGDDLLRLGEDGKFISLYPGAQSGKVKSAIENGGTVWP